MSRGMFRALAFVVPRSREIRIVFWLFVSCINEAAVFFRRLHKSINSGRLQTCCGIGEEDFMLNLFRVSNFKSLIDFEFRPAGANLIVGTNNAGKSNLCQALRFLSLTSSMSLDEAARECSPEPWHLLNVYLRKATIEMEAQVVFELGGEKLSFTYILTIAGHRRAIEGKFMSMSFTVDYECLRITGGGFNDTTLIENRSGSVKLTHEKRYLQILEQNGSVPKGQAVVETSALSNSTMLFRLFDLETNGRANLFKKYLNSWNYYNFDPAALRSNAATPMDQTLDTNGSNLCSVLYTLHNQRPRDEKKLIEAVRLLEPRLDQIIYPSPDLDHVYMFFEDKEGNKFGVQNVSEGTLRFLAICFLIIVNQRDSDEVDAPPPPPLVILEEPENGIFVAHLKPLFDKIDPSGNHGQFIFTSHNPYFIDLFDSVVEGIHMVRNDGVKSTLLRPSAEKIRAQLGQFSLGEMHFRGLLE